MLKAVLVFCQKSAKIMLIFLKSARGLHKNGHFFSDVFKHRILHFSDFQLHFSTTKCNDQCLFFPLVHSGWLSLFLDDNVDDAILERVWWTGFLEGNRWPTKPIPQASSAPLTKMRAKCIWEVLDAINKVRLCFLTQNYTNNQSKIQIMLAVLKM